MIPRTPAALAAAVAVAAALAGCPLPQALPEYPKNAPVTPPRILDDSITLNGKTVTASPATVGAAIIPVSIYCATKPQYELGATLYDANDVELVTALWFVDYDPSLASTTSPAGPALNTIPPATDPTDLTRPVTPWSFSPYDYPPTVGPACAKDTVIDAFHCAGILHVVDLVVSNEFAASGVLVPLPNRSPAPQHETQSYRWVFLLVDDPTLPCP